MKVLKSIEVQLTRYHGGSLNGNDIKKVMDHSFYVFDKFAIILKAGCRNDSLTPEKIDQKCEEYKLAFLLWDGAFAMARKQTHWQKTVSCTEGTSREPFMHTV